MSIPVILIGCGVVLLVIAVVLFLLGNKSEKKVAPSVTSEEPKAEPLTNNEVNVISESAEASAEPIVIEAPIEETTTEFDFSISEEPAATVEESSVVEPVIEEPTIIVPEMQDETKEEL